jgi:DNA-binding response OmpR family regulator
MAVSPGSRGAGTASPFDVPVEPMLVIASTEWPRSGEFLGQIASMEWVSITADDVDRGRWLASIRRVSSVLIAGDRGFRRRAVEAVRGITDVPVAVLADDPADTTELLAAGVDLVIAEAEPAATALARVAAAIRRADARRGPAVRYLRAHDLVVDLWTNECTRRGEPLALSPIEYHLLTFLMTRPTVALSTPTIIARVWPQAPADGRNALRIVVNRLRRKLGDDPRQPEFIAAIRGRGYRFVANVAEVADSLVDHAARVDVTPLLDSLTTFAERLASTAGEVAAADVLVDVLDTAGVADAMAVFRNVGPMMHLVASRRMPADWLHAVAGGVPLDPSFASAQSVLTGEVVQFADVRAVKGQFAATARQLAGAGFRACHFVPIARGGTAWGHLGLARRSSSPLDSVTMAYLRSLCASFLLHLDDTA